MILKGIEVKHKAFGIGIVSEHIDNHITIIFPQGEKKFIYPDAFKVFIKATDDTVKSFDAERRGGYLWAPKSNQDRRKVSHWLMMEEVRKGDIIIRK